MDRPRRDCARSRTPSTSQSRTARRFRRTNAPRQCPRGRRHPASGQSSDHIVRRPSASRRCRSRHLRYRQIPAVDPSYCSRRESPAAWCSSSSCSARPPRRNSPCASSTSAANPPTPVMWRCRGKGSCKTPAPAAHRSTRLHPDCGSCRGRSAQTRPTDAADSAARFPPAYRWRRHPRLIDRTPVPDP